MKIIIFTYLFPNSRNEIRGVFNLSRARAFKDKGHDVCIIAPVSLNPEFKYLWPKPQIFKQIKTLLDLLKIPYKEKIEGITVYHPKWIKPPDKFLYRFTYVFLHLFAGKKIKKISLEFGPDFIIGTWMNPFCVYAKYFKKYLKIPFFALAEGNDVYKFPFIFSGFDHLTKIINNNCDAIISVSQGMKIHISEKTELKNVHVILNGYDKSKFFLVESKKKRSPEILKIVVVAMFNPKKGHMVLLKALKLIKTPIQLLFIGNGPSMEECKNFVSKNSLNNIVHFAGKVSHSSVPSYLQDYDLLCLPSVDEGLPAAPLEAMACGLPVVGTNIQGTNEIVKNGFNGYLCQPSSIEDLADKINLASETPWDNKTISLWVASNFGWDIWVDNILNLYKKYSSKYFLK